MRTRHLMKRRDSNLQVGISWRRDRKRVQHVHLPKPGWKNSQSGWSRKSGVDVAKDDISRTRPDGTSQDLPGRLILIHKLVGSHWRILRRAGGRGHMITFIFHKVDFICNLETRLGESGEDQIGRFWNPGKKWLQLRKVAVVKTERGCFQKVFIK